MLRLKNDVGKATADHLRGGGRSWPLVDARDPDPHRCPPRRGQHRTITRREILPTPDFAELKKSARFVAGVRPHRTGGVCLSRTEINTAKGTKFLIHNYGHSAAGITLSWGCASVVRDHVELVVRQMRGTKMRPSVAVLGSGVIGLTVATELRRKWPGLPITIYAKSLDVTKTTSFIAAGQFAPSQICSEYEESELPILEDYLRRSANRTRAIENH